MTMLFIIEYFFLIYLNKIMSYQAKKLILADQIRKNYLSNLLINYAKCKCGFAKLFIVGSYFFRGLFQYYKKFKYIIAKQDRKKFFDLPMGVG